MPGTTTGSSTRDVQLIPYTTVDGIRTFKDSQILALYERTIRDSTVKTIFHDGSITSGDEFLNAMKHGDNLLYVVMYMSETVGILWLNRFKGPSCYAHFTAFSNIWGKDTVAIGRDSMRQILFMESRDQKHVFDLVYGLVPQRNTRAISWLEKIGMKPVGNIPLSIWDEEAGESMTGTLLYLTREELKP